jgi:hypothetical protein
MTIKYKYNEKGLLDEMQGYVDGTYNEHYSGRGGVQALDLICASGKGLDFTLSNVIKYAARYGEKDGTNRKDLIKIIHYGLLALNEHDEVNNESI